MQIDGYDRTYAAIKALGKAIESALAAAPFINLKISDQVFYEAEVKLCRISLDYSIWTTL